MLKQRKMLLIEDVFPLGRKGDIVSVRAGYARNYLLPKGKAWVAGARTLRMQEKLQKERRLQAEQDRKESEAVKERLASITLKVVVNADEKGHLFGSVTETDIVRLLSEQANIGLTRVHVALPQVIKELGQHEIPIHLKEDVRAKVVIQVMTSDGRMEVIREKREEKKEEPAPAETEEETPVEEE